MRHNFEEGHAVYEITPDDHHDHMVCLETGKQAGLLEHKWAVGRRGPENQVSGNARRL